MLSRKRNRALYSAEDSEVDSADVLVHEEQTTCENSRSRKKVSLSQLPGTVSRKVDRQTLRAVSVSDNINYDLCNFSTTVTEIVKDESIPVVEDVSDTDTDFLSEDDSETEENVAAPKPKHKSLDDFRDLKAEFVDQLIRTYCPTSVSEICGVCGAEGASILCLDCFLFTSCCQSCIIQMHTHHPLHRIQYFDGDTFQRTSLRELGLIVNLGHNGQPCPDPSGEVKRIVVLDMKGIQEVNLRFCTCSHLVGLEATECSQMISHGWYPATTEHPRTVAPFSTLDAFEILSGEGKLSGYHFYKSLVRLRDGPGYERIPRRYEEFMRMTREYQHLKMLIRAGKMSDSNGGLDVADGDLAVQCPACPHPHRNLPEGWDKKIDSWIYTLFVMIDANFRLKSKKKKTKNDASLGGGYSYFVREDPYMDHIKKSAKEKEIKYCDSGLRAVDHANLKGGMGYNASGVVGVQCRHMLLRQNGVGDLQKGERYANVDYVVLSSLRGIDVSRIIMSYDIVCQYNRKFTSRMLNFDEDMQLDLSKIKLGFVIPQFHIAGHGEKCRTQYNLRFREHVGRTDGENIERGWAYLNPLSMASKEMGTGSRQDYLDWHIGDWNYQRIVSFGPLFSRKLQEAVRESVKHSNVLNDFRAAFPIGVIKEIESNIKKWDADPFNNINPFAEKSRGKSIHKVCKALIEAETKEQDVTLLRSGSTSVTHWLNIGLELEETQKSIRTLFKGVKEREATATSAFASEKNAVALRKIRAWKSKQLIYMPELAESAFWNPAPNSEEGSVRCWKIDLQLPSSLPTEYRNLPHISALAQKEMKLRLAQAYDSLMEIRRTLQKAWWLFSKKKQHVSGPGQKNNTKSNIAIQVILEQRDKEVARYRRMRQAIVVLQPGGNWLNYFKVLRDEDVRHFEDDEGLGEGRRSPSWIWTLKDNTINPDEDSGETLEALKVEYAKSRARALRWYEEAQLVREEMRRVICYFNWRIGWWLERNATLKNRRDEVALGSIVYGNRQVLYLQKLGQKFRCQWEAECNMQGLPEVWNDKLSHVKDIKLLPVFHDQID